MSEARGEHAPVGGSARSFEPRVRAAASEWPGWRGPNRDAVSTETGLLTEWKAPGPPLAWKAIGLGGGFSSVSVAAGRIFTMGDRDGAQHAFALDQADGKPRWAMKLGPVHDDKYGGPRGTPTVDGELVYALGTETRPGTRPGTRLPCRPRPSVRSPTRSGR